MNQDINYWIARCASLEQELDIMKEQSTIKWRTGEPRQDGLYIVTSFDFVHKVNICRILEKVGYRWIIYISEEKPKLFGDYFDNAIGTFYSEIPSGLFPEVTFENSPQEVELKLVEL